jgi:hypothetical protein
MLLSDHPVATARGTGRRFQLPSGAGKAGRPFSTNRLSLWGRSEAADVNPQCLANSLTAASPGGGRKLPGVNPQWLAIRLTAAHLRQAASFGCEPAVTRYQPLESRQPHRS